MDIDFTALDSLRAPSPQNALRTCLEGKAGKTPTTEEKPATGENRAPEGITNKRAETRLQRRAEELQKAKDINNSYGENIRRAGSLRADILKGMKQAEDPLELLLKAVDCIGRMTGDAVIYEQAKKDAIAIYGWGLGEPYPLQITRREAVERLKRLENTVAREDIPQADKHRLQEAVKAHRGIIETIDRELETKGQKAYTPGA